MNEQIGLEKTRESLTSFLETFNKYSDEIFGEHRQDCLDDLRTKLQRQAPFITKLLLDIVGDSVFTLGSFGYSRNVALRELLLSALMGGNNELTHNFYDYKAPVLAVLNQALGIIDSGLWPPKEPKPILIIHDDELRNRCADLLGAPGSFDRVIREATTILEDRIRNKPSHETLSQLIPNSNDQRGENLVNKLLNPDNPILVISSDKGRRVAFYRILIGAFSYLRNPYHHRIDPTTEWSWAWSTVGFIDRLLSEVDSCSVENRE
jgi:hypothetical protein